VLFSDSPSLTVAYGANIVVKAIRFNNSCLAEGSQTNFDVRNEMDYQLENFHQGASCLVRYLSAISKGWRLTSLELRRARANDNGRYTPLQWEPFSGRY